MRHQIILASLIIQVSFGFYNYQALSEAGNSKALKTLNKVEMTWVDIFQNTQSIHTETFI